ncbi:MAG: penicillin-binding protein activator LpoB [Bradymonadaceae bacterium]|nr:penicillin-binding protein activator LpoB [Lujinxingiaceae bacterium]
MKNRPFWTSALALSLVFSFVLAGCGSPQYVRDSEEPRLDEYTMSLRFDRQDLDKLYEDNIKELLRSNVVKSWERQAASSVAPVVAIFPMRNETSEHIGSQLDTLLSKFETDLVNKTPASVVSHENQPDLIAEIKRQQSDAYDPQRLARYGRQLGAQFFVTGKVYDVAERVKDERRVQYFMFVQVIDVETGQIRFQNESKLTKGLIR